jgi:hypothetical protein
VDQIGTLSTNDVGDGVLAVGRGTMDGMQIELLVVPDCPHEAAAAESLTSALADIGRATVGLTVTVIDAQGAADRHRFIGSPTFSVNGLDVFCRT